MSQFPYPKYRSGILLLICGPAGSGKTTLCDQLLEEFPNLHRIVTATTRPAREGEFDGVHYHFFSEDVFKQKLENDEFYEHATVHGRLYGTLKSEVHKHLSSGGDIILNIDVQGAASFRQSAKRETFLAERLVTVFIQPDSLETIRQRLLCRNSDDANEIEKRMQSAIDEMKTADENDYVMPTRSREQDYRLISSIYLAERHRILKA
jgi:guanylate kinase